MGSGKTYIFAFMKGWSNFKTNLVLEKLGDLCFDFAKLIFGGVILAAIMQLEINTAWLFTIGFVFVLLAVVFGCILFVLSNKKTNYLWG